LSHDDLHSFDKFQKQVAAGRDTDGRRSAYSDRVVPQQRCFEHRAAYSEIRRPDMEAQRAPAPRSARTTNCSTQRGDGGDRGRWNNDPVAAQETMLDEMLRSAFGEFVRISSAPDLRAAEQQAVPA